MAVNVASLSTTLGLNSVGFKNGITEARTAVSAFSAVSIGAFARVGAGFTNLGISAARSLWGLTKGAFESADALGKASDRLGIGSKALANYHRVAQLAGIESEQFDKAIGRMGANLVEAAVNGGPLSDTLRSLGLNAKNLVGLGPDKAFLSIADAVKGIESPMIRARVAMQLWGKEGVNLISIASEGSEGIKNQADQTEKLGLALSRLDIAQIEAANDSFTDLGNVFKGMANQLATELAPYLSQLGQWLTDFGVSGGRNVNIVTAAFEAMDVAVFTVLGTLDNLDLAWKGIQLSILKAAQAASEFAETQVQKGMQVGGSAVEHMIANFLEFYGLPGGAEHRDRAFGLMDEKITPKGGLGLGGKIRELEDQYNSQYGAMQGGSSPGQQSAYAYRQSLINSAGDAATGISIRNLDLARTARASEQIDAMRKAGKELPEPFHGGFSRILGTAAAYSGGGQDTARQQVDEQRKTNQKLEELIRKIPTGVTP